MDSPPRDFSDEVHLHRSRTARGVYLLVGLLLTGLGIAGIVLPLLPGMPFLILALACFARASTRFYNLLLNNRIVGPPLHAWRNHRRIPKHVKPRAIFAVVLAFSLAAAFALSTWWARAIWLILGAAVVALIVRLPSYDASLATNRLSRAGSAELEDGRTTERAS